MDLCTPRMLDLESYANSAITNQSRGIANSPAKRIWRGDMDSSALQKYEDIFRRWERLRRRLRIWLWVTPFLAIFAAFYMFMFFRITSVENGLHSWQILVIVGIGLAYTAFPILFQRQVTRRRLGRLSREACIFAATSAAEDLRRGNSVRASLAMDRLLSALSDLLGQKLVALGTTSVAPRDVMHATPQTIPRRAVFEAIQSSGETKDFEEELDHLVIELGGDADKGYIAAQKFLVWLGQKSETYKAGSETLLEKHPTFKAIVQIVGPIIVPPLGLLAFELVRRL